jgi:NAD(P)-dependent dehydrogenase (short-subunit alcohol dehydrogenase family)
MGSLDGRIAIITGAGRGLGRQHALLFAREGAKVVVNDLGGDLQGMGPDRAPAQLVVDEIRAMGGQAVANTDSVCDWDGAKRMVDQAIGTFGDLHVLVNNAGILRDGMISDMTEADWDMVIATDLKGHFCPTHHAVGYWLAQSRAGSELDRSVIHTTSTSGLYANPGQTNYGAAKSAVATLSQIAAKELLGYRVRSNCIAPAARTRMTLQTPGIAERVAPPENEAFDFWDPANVSPFVAYLATANCPFSGETFHVGGGQVQRICSWTACERIVKEARWTVEELSAQGPRLAGAPAEHPPMPA